MSKTWNDTDVPLAYLITFCCHGTWLHGDKRGSVDRANNVYGTPRLPQRPARHDYVRSISKNDPVYLDSRRRNCVERSIRETCQIRKWRLFALCARTNHVHCVVCAAGRKPDFVLTALKANATRLMREEGCWNSEASPWAEKGSKRYLWNEDSLFYAVDYVNNGQGGDLPDFI